MKRLLTVACLMLTAGAATAQAASDLEILERKVAAYATTELDVYKKGLCVCADGSDKEGRAGRVRYAVFSSPSGTPQLEVWCQVSIYDQQGDAVSSVGCWTFQPLAR